MAALWLHIHPVPQDSEENAANSRNKLTSCDQFRSDTAFDEWPSVMCNLDKAQSQGPTLWRLASLRLAANGVTPAERSVKTHQISAGRDL